MAPEMFLAFFVLKELHELIWVLRQLSSLCPSGVVEDELARRIAELEIRALGGRREIAWLDVAQCRRDCQVFLELVDWQHNERKKASTGVE